jgi:hypothetical protein
MRLWEAIAMALLVSAGYVLFCELMFYRAGL